MRTRRPKRRFCLAVEFLEDRNAPSGLTSLVDLPLVALPSLPAATELVPGLFKTDVPGNSGAGSEDRGGSGVQLEVGVKLGNMVSLDLGGGAGGQSGAVGVNLTASATDLLAVGTAVGVGQSGSLLQASVQLGLGGGSEGSLLNALVNLGGDGATLGGTIGFTAPPPTLLPPPPLPGDGGLPGAAGPGNSLAANALVPDFLTAVPAVSLDRGVGDLADTTALAALATNVRPPVEKTEATPPVSGGDPATEVEIAPDRAAPAEQINEDAAVAEHATQELVDALNPLLQEAQSRLLRWSPWVLVAFALGLTARQVTRYRRSRAKQRAKDEHDESNPTWLPDPTAVADGS